MIRTLFGFRGTLGRLQFIAWYAAALVVIMLVVFASLLFGALLALFVSPDGGGPALLGRATGLTCVLLSCWMTLALMTKRVRDAGYDPFYPMVCVTLVLVIDGFALARLTESRFFWPFAQHTPLGGLLAFALLLFVFCWPSSSQTGDASPANDRRGEPGPASLAP